MKWMTALLVLLTSLSSFALETGKPAPDFKLGDVKLSQFKGKVVVLEWLNHGCPFVRKHYDSGNMQALQEKYTKKDVVWLSIISSAKDKQGYVDAAGAEADKTKNKSFASKILLDPIGAVGMQYGAKTTPHMYVIDAQGTLVYQGAIDDKPDTDKESIKGAKNYVAEALDLVLAGKKVTHATTKSYGCGVKYQ